MSDEPLQMPDLQRMLQVVECESREELPFAELRGQAVKVVSERGRGDRYANASLEKAGAPGAARLPTAARRLRQSAIHTSD